MGRLAKVLTEKKEKRKREKKGKEKKKGKKKRRREKRKGTIRKGRKGKAERDIFSTMDRDGEGFHYQRSCDLNNCLNCRK